MTGRHGQGKPGDGHNSCGGAYHFSKHERRTGARRKGAAGCVLAIGGGCLSRRSLSRRTVLLGALRFFWFGRSEKGSGTERRVGSCVGRPNICLRAASPKDKSRQNSVCGYDASLQIGLFRKNRTKRSSFYFRPKAAVYCCASGRSRAITDSSRRACLPTCS